MSSGYVVRTPSLLATAHNADGSPLVSIGQQTLVKLPSGEVITVIQAMLRGLIKREPDGGRYYEVEPPSA